MIAKDYVIHTWRVSEYYKLKRWTVCFWCIEKSKPPSGGEEHIFSFRGTTENLGHWTWKICSWSWICKVTSAKKMIGLWIKSIKIIILKQKNRKLYGFEIKFCEDKKSCFCDVLLVRVLKKHSEWFFYHNTELQHTRTTNHDARRAFVWCWIWWLWL
jgi:hypothetical protein